MEFLQGELTIIGLDGKTKVVHEGEDVYDRDISYGIFDVFKRG